MPTFLFTPSPNKDAAKFIKDKAAVSRSVFDGLLPELRGLAYTITGVESMAVLKKTRDAIAKLPAGGIGMRSRQASPATFALGSATARRNAPNCCSACMAIPRIPLPNTK